MPREIDEFRRRFLGSVAMTLAAGRLGLFDSPTRKPGTRPRTACEGHTRHSLR